MTLLVVGLYVGLPLLVFGVIAAAVVLGTRGGRAEDFPVLNPQATPTNDAETTEADQLAPDHATAQEPTAEH